MTIGRLIYTPREALVSGEHPKTFVLMVDDIAYQKHKCGDKSIPLVEVVNSFKVFKVRSCKYFGRRSVHRFVVTVARFLLWKESYLSLVKPFMKINDVFILTSTLV